MMKSMMSFVMMQGITHAMKADNIILPNKSIDVIDSLTLKSGDMSKRRNVAASVPTETLRHSHQSSKTGRKMYRHIGQSLHGSERRHGSFKRVTVN